MTKRFQLTEDATVSTPERDGHDRLLSGQAAGGETDSRDRLTRDALLFATATSADGGPAAALDLLGTTVLGRLLGQLQSIGIRRVWVATRPEWRAAVEEAAAERSVELAVVTSESVSDDLRLTAEVAEVVGGPLLVGNAHVVTHREALAGLLVDPRAGSGVLMTASALKARWSFAFGALRGRLTSAESPYHRIERDSGYFLGLMVIDPRDRARLVEVSRELAGLAAQPPKPWEDELERKVDQWRIREWRVQIGRETGVLPSLAEAPEPGSVQLDAATEEKLALRRRLAVDDALPLLVVGLVRSEVELWPSAARQFFYATPLSAEDAEHAAEELARLDEGRLLLDSAVKASDGFFTTYFVSPYSKYLARFAARRGWTPNAITTASLAIGIGAAAAFAVGSRAGFIAGAVLLQISFTVDCVDGQLARYTRTFSALGAWLDSVFDRTKEYLVYAGLAVGSARGLDDQVWVLAAAALTLQTVRHMSDFSYVASQRRVVATKRSVPLEHPEDFVPRPATGRAARGQSPAATLHDAPLHRLALAGLRSYRVLRRSGTLQWANRIVRLPIGERFALISITAAIASPRVTFVALLAWGGLAAFYAFSVRVLISYGVPRRIIQAVLR
jgi:phosphatidylglycerophosphate synthase